MFISMINEIFNRNFEILLKGFSKPIDSDILYLFSSFIASNPDFKYNITYLSDEISDFLRTLEGFKEKYKLFSKKIVDFHSNVKGKYIIDVIFDEVFKFTIGNEIIESFCIDKNEHFPFYQLGKKNFTVRFVFNQELVYLHEISNFEVEDQKEIDTLFEEFIIKIEKNYVCTK